MKYFLKTVVLLLVMTSFVGAATVNWYTRAHTDRPVRGFPHWKARHITFKPSLGGGTGSNDFMIGPFDISKNPVYPQALTVLLRALSHDATNDDIDAYLVFEVKIDSVVGYTGAGIESETFSDSLWVKLDSININNSQDSTYPGLSTLNGGDAIIFRFPPGVEQYRMFWAIESGADSLKIIDMHLLLID